ncbi:MAG: Fe-Mn family superoxide dismutase [Pseudomonadales bacterium]
MMNPPHRETASSALPTTRRTLIKGATLGVGASLLGTGVPVGAQSPTSGSLPALETRAFNQSHQPAPLRFDPARLKGLSQRLIESHWSNNYGGSVRALNETNRRLAEALSDPELPAYVYNDLKREHLMRTGSVVLHELYFGNLGGSGQPAAATRSFIASSFGDYDRWETEFRRIAAGLGGGAGWVVLAINRHLGTLENYWMADHMHGPTVAQPLLVLDMYEHSYHLDYGAAAARYVDAFFANIDWDRVAARARI